MPEALQHSQVLQPLGQDLAHKGVLLVDFLADFFLVQVIDFPGRGVVGQECVDVQPEGPVLGVWGGNQGQVLDVFAGFVWGKEWGLRG